VTASPLASRHDQTALGIILAVSLGHLLNDLMQSLIPAAYPILQANLSLSFTQIGLITLVFQGTASVLQPLIGLYTDKRPLPYALSAGMASTGLGLLALAHASTFPVILASVALIGLGSSIFHPEASRIARLAAGSRPGFAQSLFQLGGNAGSALGPWLPLWWSSSAARARSAGLRWWPSWAWVSCLPWGAGSSPRAPSAPWQE
jgi:FSR family fosmidomycin resistance protein-like MFS transporter